MRATHYIQNGAILALIALSFFFVWKQGQDIKNITKDNTRITMSQCKRTREFSPSIAKFYQEKNVLTPQQLEDYIRTIPTHC